MVVEETLTEEAFQAGVAAETVDPAQAYYAATVAEGPSETSEKSNATSNQCVSAEYVAR